MAGLNINRLVRVQVNLAPLAAARRGFGTLLIIGDSAVIGTGERIRTYVDLESVAGDFGLEAPEYKAAALYFGQTPRPQQLMIGRWAAEATGAELRGGIFDDPDAALETIKASQPDTMTLTVDGTEQHVNDFTFQSATNMNGIAAAIQGAFTGITCVWDGQRFIVKSNTTGDTSTLGYFTAGGDVLKLDQAQALPPTAGQGAETAAEAVQALADASGAWYGCAFAAADMPDADAVLEIAAFIEGASTTRIFGVTETDSRVLEATYTDDLASKLKPLNYKRTCVQYSANPYAICSLFGRAFSVNFAANRSVITVMYKQEPGVAPAQLTESQAQALKAKRCNVFTEYNNNTSIIQYGVMSGQAYFDEVHGLDWFADALQNEEYNLLYQSKTKIPQTDAGQNELVNCAAAVCQEAINNGLIAPGQWNADGFGQLSRGDYLTEGFYIFTPPMSEQAQSIREQRIAPPIQIALKLAGAIHEIDCIVDVNR